MGGKGPDVLDRPPRMDEKCNKGAPAEPGALVMSAATPRDGDQALAAGSASFVIAASLALIFCSSTLFSTSSNTTFEPPSPMR